VDSTGDGILPLLILNYKKCVPVSKSFNIIFSVGVGSEFIDWKGLYLQKLRF